MGEVDPVKVFVGGLSYDTSEDRLREAFGEMGTITFGACGPGYPLSDQAWVQVAY
jgi:RNA recognition motif-containing protein